MTESQPHQKNKDKLVLTENKKGEAFSHVVMKR